MTIAWYNIVGDSFFKEHKFHGFHGFLKLLQNLFHQKLTEEDYNVCLTCLFSRDINFANGVKEGVCGN